MIYKLVCLLLIAQLVGSNLYLSQRIVPVTQSITEAVSQYEDDFNSPQLDPKWHWVREDPAHWSLTANSGYLRIITQLKDIWQANNTASLLLQAAPSGDFAIETKIYMTPSANYQQGGLVMYGNDDNYVRLTYGFFDRQGFELGKEINGNFQSIQISAPLNDHFYLKIKKIGTDFSGYYSEDGNNWVLVGLQSGVNLTPSYMGLLAFNAQDVTTVEIPADFDYFHVQALNILTLNWKRSSVLTGTQTGPQDASGHYWNKLLFDDSSWSSTSLPDQGSDSNADDRYYRAHFTWDGNSDVNLGLASDDGLAIYINGDLMGSWGGSWRQVLCVNNPNSQCSVSVSVPDQTIPKTMLQVGDNLIAVDLWNGAICCYYYLNVTTNITSSNILINNNSFGYFSTSLGSMLAGTQLQFPPQNTIGAGEPNLYPALEPDISITALFLGNWLSPKPIPLNPNWSGLQNIPKTWAPNTELAIIYPIDAGSSGIKNITGSFGVDNGMYLWINGEYKFGATQPGSLSGFEYTDIPLGDLQPGINYIEIVLEDHGQIDGFTLQIETGRTPSSSISIPNIPLFSQLDSSWASHTFALSTDTISNQGCNLTSHAMVLDYYANTYKPTFTTNPDQLNNDWVMYFNDVKTKIYSGYSDSLGNLSWVNIPNYAEKQKIYLENKDLFETGNGIIDAALFSGNPPIIEVLTKNLQTNLYDVTHFIVVTGKTVENNLVTYNVNDPAFGQGTLLDMAAKGNYFGSQALNIFSYRPKLNKQLKNLTAYQPYIFIIAHSPVHLLITDPMGRKEGFDPRTGQSWNDIPESIYTIQSFTGFDGVSLPEEKLLFIPNPIQGNYDLQTIGYADGTYKVDITTANGANSPGETSFGGTAQVSSVDNRTISFFLTYLYLPLLKK